MRSPRGYARRALAMGAGDDIGALTMPAPRTRIVLSADALKIVAMGLILAAIVTITVVFSRQLMAVEAYEGSEHPPAQPVSPQETGASEETGNSPGSTGQVDASGQQILAGGEPAVIVVHVSGAVVSPGLVEVPHPARVNDVVEAAGGLSEDADPALINLAAHVSDGEHIHVPAHGEEPAEYGATSQSSGSSGLVNINTASASELETLPGIGPVTAEAIMTWRHDNGSFTSVEQLIEVNGIGPKTLDQLRPHVTV
ncbi:MAG: helix-hairpin-helix domain-containing protein [Arcanobacterium sp.]